MIPEIVKDDVEELRLFMQCLEFNDNFKSHELLNCKRFSMESGCRFKCEAYPYSPVGGLYHSDFQ